MSRQIIRSILAVIFIGLFIAPLLLTFSNSLMSSSEAVRRYNEKDIAITFIPDRIDLEQYIEILFKRPAYLRMFWNSLFITLPVIIGQIAVSVTCGFAFSKLNFPFRNQLFFIYIVTMMMPFQVTMVPNYLIAFQLGLLNTHGAIILPGVFSAFGVFLMRQFMFLIPDELMEAAKIQGAGYGTIFLNIILPLSKSGIISLGLLTWLEYWNLMERPYLMINDWNKQPLSLILAFINQQERGIASAAGIIFLLPVLFLFIWKRSHLSEGIIHSGLKG